MSLIPTFDVINISILAVALLHLVIGIFVMTRGEHRKANILFAFLELSLIAWSVCMVYYRSAAPSEIMLWAKALYAVALLIPFSFLYFVYSFPDERADRFPWAFQLASFVPLVFLLWVTLTDRLITSVLRADPAEPQIFFDPLLYTPYMLYYALYFGWAYVRLAVKARSYSVANPSTRVQINYVLFGTVVSTLLATPPNLILPMFGIFVVNWLGQVVIVIMAICIAYAIFKHHLLNIKVIAAELFALLIGLISVIQVLLSQSTLDLIVRSTLLLIVGVFIYFLVRSVFDEIRSKEEIERLNQSMQEFVAITSHQIRSPLTHIKAALSTIRDGDFGQVDPKTMPVLSKVSVSTERLITLVNDLLDMSSMESGKMQYSLGEFDFTGLVDSVAAEFIDPAKDKGVTLNWQRPNEPIIIKADQRKLRQVIFNLVDNAIKYTEHGLVEIKIVKESSFVEFSVKDTGAGMSKETIAHLFEKFSRAKSGSVTKAEGTGLGLYVAKRIVNDHEAELWAESEGPGKGSIFHLRLVTNPTNAESIKSTQDDSQLAQAA